MATAGHRDTTIDETREEAEATLRTVAEVLAMGQFSLRSRVDQLRTDDAAWAIVHPLAWARGVLSEASDRIEAALEQFAEHREGTAA